MAYKISKECTACGACAEQCPTEAILKGDPIYSIDPDKCTDCGACESVCPASAISAG
jgi:ferredoxin